MRTDATTVDTSRVGGRSRDWFVLHALCERMLLHLAPADGRRPTVATILHTLDAQDSARRSGAVQTAAALWSLADTLACRMAGRWNA